MGLQLAVRLLLQVYLGGVGYAERAAQQLDEVEWPSGVEVLPAAEHEILKYRRYVTHMVEKPTAPYKQKLSKRALFLEALKREVRRLSFCWAYRIIDSTDERADRCFRLESRVS